VPRDRLQVTQFLAARASPRWGWRDDNCCIPSAPFSWESLNQSTFGSDTLCRSEAFPRGVQPRRKRGSKNPKVFTARLLSQAYSQRPPVKANTVYRPERLRAARLGLRRGDHGEALFVLLRGRDTLSPPARNSPCQGDEYLVGSYPSRFRTTRTRHETKKGRYLSLLSAVDLLSQASTRIVQIPSIGFAPN
jgi:hypothetical protein